ncbi:hypothetical protein AMTRI_Chr13g85550 [Amborella trichopoda]
MISNASTGSRNESIFPCQENCKNSDNFSIIKCLCTSMFVVHACVCERERDFLQCSPLHCHACYLCSSGKEGDFLKCSLLHCQACYLCASGKKCVSGRWYLYNSRFY